MTLNIITNQTAYVTFTVYAQDTGLLSHTFDIPKANISSICTYPNEKVEDALGIVVVNTITQLDQSNKGNALLELSPTKWALSTSSTVAIVDAATLRATLLGYFIV